MPARMKRLESRSFLSRNRAVRSMLRQDDIAAHEQAAQEGPTEHREEVANVQRHDGQHAIHHGRVSNHITGLRTRGKGKGGRRETGKTYNKKPTPARTESIKARTGSTDNRQGRTCVCFFLRTMTSSSTPFSVSVMRLASESRDACSASGRRPCTTT